MLFFTSYLYILLPSLAIVLLIMHFFNYTKLHYGVQSITTAYDWLIMGTNFELTNDRVRYETGLLFYFLVAPGHTLRPYIIGLK